MKFSELKNDSEFMYNGLLYKKVYGTQGLNLRYGFFTINQDEEVELIKDEKISIIDRILKIFGVVR